MACVISPVKYLAVLGSGAHFRCDLVWWGNVWVWFGACWLGWRFCSGALALPLLVPAGVLPLLRCTSTLSSFPGYLKHI